MASERTLPPPPGAIGRRITRFSAPPGRLQMRTVLSSDPVASVRPSALTPIRQIREACMPVSILKIGS